jgi:hypothetical protein
MLYWYSTYTVFGSTTSNQACEATGAVWDREQQVPPLKGRELVMIPIHQLTNREMDTCKWLDMTSDEEWRPYSEEFEEKESELI